MLLELLTISLYDNLVLNFPGAYHLQASEHILVQRHCVPEMIPAALGTFLPVRLPLVDSWVTGNQTRGGTLSVDIRIGLLSPLPRQVTIVTVLSF